MKGVNRAAEKIDLRDLTRTQLAEYIHTLGIPSSRAADLFSWLYQLGSSDLSQLVSLKKEFRDKLQLKSYISSFAAAQVERSKDGTVKYGFVLDDGAVIETVLIPGDGRHTLCISSQVGCAMGCKFCLTGGMGLKRNLRPGEMVNQVVAVLEHLAQEGMTKVQAREIINNLVFMGMGEPLANYDNLIIALNILMDERGFEFTERRVTVSTCGIVPRMADLCRDARVNLAVSLHTVDNTTRSTLMPVNRKYSVDELLDACRSYPLPRKKVILFEYILIQGVNDSLEDAKELAERLSGIACRINLLPFNESAELPYKSPEQERIKDFQGLLRKAGFIALVRKSRGADISAACGQLAKGAAARKKRKPRKEN